MTTCWRRCLRTRREILVTSALLLTFVGACGPVHASPQAKEDVLSQREVDSLRDAAFVPSERLVTFMHILDDREKRIQTLLAKRRGHTDFGGEMHDVLDQFGQITDELNDNLDEYSRNHRDVRKVLPKILESADRWSTTLRSPAEDEAYGVVRRIALDNVKDCHDLASALGPELDAFYKAHPEAEKEEKRRTADPHAVHGESPE